MTFWWHRRKSQGSEFGFILWASWMSVQNSTAIYQILLYIIWIYFSLSQGCQPTLSSLELRHWLKVCTYIYEHLHKHTCKYIFETHSRRKGWAISWFRSVQRRHVHWVVLLRICSKWDMTDAGSLPSFITQAPKKGNENHAAITVTSWLSYLYANPRLALGSPKCNDDSLTLSMYEDRKSGCVGWCHAGGTKTSPVGKDAVQHT